MPQPNVLWICTDQQRFDTLGCYGNAVVETPNIDRLAERGVRFERAYTQSPVCSPSRASFLTGRYPRTTGCRQNGQPIPDDEELISRWFADEGFTCGLSGKLHISPCNPNGDQSDPSMERRIDDGYHVFHWSHGSPHPSPANEYKNDWIREQGKEYGRTTHEESRFVQTSVPASDHQTTWCAQKAINFIETFREQSDPWLFSVNIFDPHFPFDPPEALLEKYLEKSSEIPLPNYADGELNDKPVYQRIAHRGGATGESEEFNRGDVEALPYPEMDEQDHRAIRAAYWAMVDLIDQQVGRLLDALERTGQREDTLVIFTSDHGEMLGDHGFYLKGPFFYEPAVRVPLIMSYPGEIPEGEERDQLVELVDLVPTILEAADMTVPDRVQGKSLWPLVTERDVSETHREGVYCEYYKALDHHEDPTPYATMVRTDQYKLVRYHGLDTGELYDMEEHPRERTNLWDNPDYSELQQTMLTHLTDKMAQTIDPEPTRLASW